MSARRNIAIGVAVVAGLFVLIQAVPYGRAHANPPVIAEPPWDGPQTRALAQRACFDCHSNETVWPWYSRIAPMSWAVQDHVDEGRGLLNFSEWNRPQEEAQEAGKEVAEGEMPIAMYTWLHAEARLTPAERDQLQRGLDATLGSEGTAGGTSAGEGSEEGEQDED